MIWRFLFMQKSASGKMRVRMRVMLFLFLVFGFAVILGKLFTLQIVQGEELQQLAVEQQTRSTTLGARRGAIYDRNGNVLARSATVWDVCISPAELNQDTVDKVAGDLAEILQVDKQKILEEAADRRYYYKCIKKRVERDVADMVLEYTTENKVEGVFFEQATKRYYRYGTLASTVLGFTNYDGQGAYGLEAYYDKTLSGTAGMVVSAKNAKGSDMPFKYQQQFPAQDGNSIVLTIDETIQHYLEKNLETAIVEHSIGNRAAGVAMNPKTGEILAMATKQDFDPNDPFEIADPNALTQLQLLPEGSKEYNDKKKQLQYDQWRNKAISDPYEPGSVFKIITAATALDNGVLSIHDHFNCTGSFKVSDRNISCWKKGGHGGQTFIEGMQNSCNPVFIQVGQRIGARLLYDYMESFGLGEVTGIDLPGEAPGIRQAFEVLNKPGKVELASTSFGQTFKVTPLQLITATSAAVNGGKLMQPYIVKQVLDPEGNVISTTQPTVKRQVISEETSATMRMLTEAVVQEGSGKKAAIPGFRIGGKTGTSEKLDLKPLELNVLSFVGFAPADDPQIAVLVMLDEPKLDHVFGSVIAAPVVGAVLQESLPYMNIDPQYTQEELADKEVKVPDLIGFKPHDAQAELTPLGLKTRIVGNGADVLRQIPNGNQTIAKGGTVILYTHEDDIKTDIAIPDVVGLTAQGANKVIVGAGLNIELRGLKTDGVPTVVESQWPLPGTEAKTGDIVIVTLVEGEQKDPRSITTDADVEEALP